MRGAMLSRASIRVLPALRHRSTGYSLVLPPLCRRAEHGRRPATLASSRHFATSVGKAEPSTTKATSYATPILPLPRSIATSSALALIHVDHPPSTWPSHLELESRFFFEVMQKFKGLSIRALACYDGQSSSQGEPHWGKQGKDEIYRMTLHDANGRELEFKDCSIRTLAQTDFDLRVRAFLEEFEQAPTATKQILICTHGSRDCRCSDIGGDLLAALGDDLAQRGLQNDVRLGQVSHLGGHKYAANAILFPSLNILSNLRPEHAPQVVSHVLDSQHSPMWDHFKGSFGMSSEAQEALWSQANTSSTPSGAVPQSGERKKVQVKFSTHDGQVAIVDALVGENLMEVAKREELGAVEGACGGALECATCHVYLPAKSAEPSSVDYLNLSDISDDEDDMLGYAIGFDEDRSRLGCQIRIDKALSDWSLKSEKGIGLPRY